MLSAIGHSVYLSNPVARRLYSLKSSLVLSPLAFFSLSLFNFHASPPFQTPSTIVHVLTLNHVEINHLGRVSEILIEIEVSGMRFALHCKWIYGELPQLQPLSDHQFKVAPSILLCLGYHLLLHPCSLITSPFVLL